MAIKKTFFKKMSDFYKKKARLQRKYSIDDAKSTSKYLYYGLKSMHNDPDFADFWDRYERRDPELIQRARDAKHQLMKKNTEQ